MDEDIRRMVCEEARLGSTGHGRWYATYLSRSYRAAVEAALTRVGRTPLAVLKTDLWNECLGGGRDILGFLGRNGSFHLVGVDSSLPVCVMGRRNVPRVLVVQADIRALPFRSDSFDAVLDLSTIDHVNEDGMAGAIGEYRRLLRLGGVLLVVFWQRTVVILLRLAAKRLLGLRERGGQRYFARARVAAALGRGVGIVSEFAAGVLLVPPHRVTRRLLARVSADRIDRVLGGLVALEQSRTWHRLLRPLAGLHGITAVKQGFAGEA